MRGFALLAVFGSLLSAAHAAEPVQDAAVLDDEAKDPKTPNLNVTISTTFPQAAIFKPTLVNGRTTE